MPMAPWQRLFGCLKARLRTGLLKTLAPWACDGLFASKSLEVRLLWRQLFSPKRLRRQPKTGSRARKQALTSAKSMVFQSFFSVFLFFPLWFHGAMRLWLLFSTAHAAFDAALQVLVDVDSVGSVLLLSLSSSRDAVELKAGKLASR